MNRVCEILFLTTWWTYDPADQSAHSVFVHWFNLFEGVAWIGEQGVLTGELPRGDRLRLTAKRREIFEISLARCPYSFASDCSVDVN